MLTFANLHDSGFTTSIITLVLMSILTLTSTLLNPLMFFYNYKKTSIPGRLYTILSMMDFIAGATAFIIMIIHASTIDYNNCPSDMIYQEIFCKATTFQKVASVIIYALTPLVGELTAIISIIRCFQVMFPFYYIRFRWVVLGLVGVLVYELINCVIQVFGSSPSLLGSINLLAFSAEHPFFRHLKDSQQSFYGLLYGMSMVLFLQIIALIGTSIVVLTLLKQKADRLRKVAHESDVANKSYSGCFKAILLNVTNMAQIMLYVFILFKFSSFHLAPGEKLSGKSWFGYYLIWVNILVCTSTDPIIFLSLTPRSRDLVRETTRRLLTYITNTGTTLMQQQRDTSITLAQHRRRDSSL